MPATKLRLGLSQHHHSATDYVFTTVITDPFNHSRTTGVTDAEAFTRDTVEEGFTVGGTVHDGVTADDVAGWLRREGITRTNDGRPPDRPLARSRCPRPPARNTLGQEGGKALTGGAIQAHLDGANWQTFVAVTLGDFTGEHGADGAVDVFDGQFNLDRLTLLQRWLGLCHQLLIQGFFQRMVLGFGMRPRYRSRNVRLEEDLGEVQTLSLPVFDACTLVQQVGATVRSSNLRMPISAIS